MHVQASFKAWFCFGGRACNRLHTLASFLPLGILAAPMMIHAHEQALLMVAVLFVATLELIFGVCTIT
jgi:hypothetical protein